MLPSRFSMGLTAIPFFCFLFVSCLVTLGLGSNALMSGLNLSKFPELYNPNVVGGRLFIQSLSYNDDRVIPEWVMGQAISTVADNTRNFFYPNNPNPPVANQYINSIYVSKGFYVEGLAFEVGGIYRHHQDVAFSYLSGFLDYFHLEINQPSNVPAPEHRFQATVGKTALPSLGGMEKFFGKVCMSISSTSC